MKNVPRLIFWELTKKCNLRCVHCRAEAGPDESPDDMGTGEIISVIDSIAAHYRPILVLTGGEPLYRDDIFAIASHAASTGFQVALASNGTLITGDAAEHIRESGIRRVSISIDGADATTHDGFRGIDGAFAAAMKGIENLRAAGVEFQMNTTITRRNADSIKEIMLLADKLGAKALHLFMLVPVGCGAEIAETDMISKERYEDVLNWFYEQSKLTALELKATCAPHFYRIMRQRAHEEKREVTVEADGMAALTRGCLAGSGVCFISNTGDVQPCGYLPLKAGNVRERPFAEIWEGSSLFHELRDLNSLKGKCGACEYRAFCGGCRARAYSQTGDHLAEEPFCVYIPKMLRN